MALYDEKLKRMICGPIETTPPTVCHRIPRQNGRCRWHGGNHPRGVSHHLFKHGKYSAYLPQRIAAQYKASRQHPEQLSLRDEIAAVDARLTDLFTRVDTGESGGLWKSLKQAHTDFIIHKGQGDVRGMQDALEKLDTLIEKGSIDHLAWVDVFKAVDLRRKLVRTEHQRNAELEQNITAERALVLMGQIVEIVASEVSDRKALNNIAIKIQQLGMIGETPVYGVREPPVSLPSQPE